MTLPMYGQAIKNALTNGYRADAKNGVIFGLKGAPLKITLNGLQRYPTVPLVVVGMPKRYYVVPAHKVIGFELWGDKAFAPGIHVRHGKLGVLDITEANLSLGTASENERDKFACVRSRVGAIARAAQSNLVNAKLTWSEVTTLRSEHKKLRSEYPRKLPSGAMVNLMSRYGISKTNINDIVKGKTWKTAKVF